MKLYCIKSKDGKYFRSKGYGGYGASWVDSLDKAKLYSKIGPAKAQITYWYKNFPEFGCPDLLVFEIDEKNCEIMDMKELTEKNIRAKKDREKNLSVKSKREQILRLEAEINKLKNNANHR